MTARRKPRPSPLATRLCVVHVERGGVQITVGDVPAVQAVSVAIELLRQIKRHEREFPALAPAAEVIQIGGYHPLEVTEDQGAQRMGF